MVLTWPDAIDLISRMSKLGEILTLNVFSININDDMPFL